MLLQRCYTETKPTTRRNIIIIHEINGNKNLFMIFGDNNGRFPHCHTILLSEGQEITIFDPQCGRDLLEKELNSMGKTWNNIKNIVNTHFHADHTGSNAFIKRKNPHVQILIHREDAEAIRSTTEYFRRYGLIGEAKTQYESVFNYLGYRQLIPDQILEEGDIIPGGFKVIHSPGHTPGHCCFLKSGVLISGDVDLVGRPWVSNVTSNVLDFYNSINKLQNLEINVILPGHGLPIFKKTKIQTRLETFQKKLVATGKKILELIEKASPLNVILDKRSRNRDVASSGQNPLMKLFLRYDTLNYLEYLEQAGKIKKFERNGQNLWEKK
jgi:glyoxylase-like metal-dependent hydrolase (beta-lactamase superfamily II)